MERRSIDSQKTFDESTKPKKNLKVNNLIKKSLLLISTLAGVAIGTFFGAYQLFAVNAASLLCHCNSYDFI